MKIFRTLPTNDNFFQRYATLIPTLHKLGYIAQMVSALTEFSIIYALVYSGIVDFFPGQAHLVGLIGAILGTAFLEIGLRKFTPYSVRAVLYGRFGGLDAVMTFFIILVTVGLLASSGLLSFKGSRSMVEAVAPDPEQWTTAAADSLFQEEQDGALQAYRADSAAISSRYAAQIASKRQEYQSKIDVQRSRMDRYKARETSEGKSYATSISYIQSNIEKLEADQDGALAGLQAKQADELAVVLQRRRDLLDQARAEWQATKGEVKEFNEESKADNEATVTGYGYGMAGFTVVCLFVFFCSVVIHEVHHRGSGIEEKVEPTQYHFSQGVGGALFHALSDRWQYMTRSRIHAFEAKTPPPPLPVQPGALYDLTSIDQRRYQLQAGQGDPDQDNVIQMVPRRLPQTTGAGIQVQAGAVDLADHALQFVEATVRLESENFHAAADQMRLKALDVIKAYLGPQGTLDAIQALYQALIEYVNEEGPNPFEHHHRRPIGFQNTGTKNADQEAQNDELTTARYNGPVSDPLQRACDNCQKVYRARAMNQRFCSTDCRLEYHAQKHDGQKFNPKFNKKSRS